MRDVARLAGVSTMTVSRVVNSGQPVTDATRERVLHAIERLGYRPNSLARGLRPNQATGLVGLLVANLANPFYSQLAVAVEHRARADGYAVIVANTSEDPGRERELVDDLLGRRVDGLLIVPTGDDHRYLAPEIERGTAVVFLSRPPQGLDVDSAVVDDYQGARDGVAALLAEGHRRVGYLGHPGHIWTARQRMRGYRDALTAAGLPVDDALVREGLTDAHAAQRAAAELLGHAEPPTALFTTNNRVTIGALRTLRRLGREVDLVGFDDFDFADLLDQSFTVVNYDAEELGRAGAELLATRIAGHTGPPRSRVVSTRLIRRGPGSA